MDTGAKPKIGIYVAVADNDVIGREGGLPWRLSTDLKRFKSLTLGKPIVMGRKTWDSFPIHPLPGRTNIVITRQTGFDAEGAVRAGSLGEAFKIASRENPDEICVIGGGEIFRETIASADVLHVTHVKARVDGDTIFPPIDRQVWRKVSGEDVLAGDRDSHATEYAVYVRNGATIGR